MCGDGVLRLRLFVGRTLARFCPTTFAWSACPRSINSTPFFQVEQILTEKLRTEFIGRGRYTVIPDAAAADAVVTGTVTSISVQPVGFTENQLASRYQFTLTMSVTFSDARTNQALWTNNALNTFARSTSSAPAAIRRSKARRS